MSTRLSTSDFCPYSPARDPSSPFRPDATKPTAIILVKGMPTSILTAEISKYFSQYGSVKRIISKPSTSHFYIEFDTAKTVDKITDISDSNELFIYSKPLKVMRINKIPLDLNESSKVILITF
jgi:hypothetical protein